MFGSSVYCDNNLKKFIDFRAVENKETRAQDGSMEKIPCDVKTMCINAIQGLTGRDVEELRLFEYSLSLHKKINDENVKSNTNLNLGGSFGMNQDLNRTQNQGFLQNSNVVGSQNTGQNQGLNQFSSLGSNQQQQNQFGVGGGFGINRLTTTLSEQNKSSLWPSMVSSSNVTQANQNSFGSSIFGQSSVMNNLSNQQSTQPISLSQSFGVSQPSSLSQNFNTFQQANTSQPSILSQPSFGGNQAINTSQPLGTSQLFNTSQPQSTSQLFGSTQPQGTSQLFGSTQPQGTSQLFGSTQPQGTSQLFGSTQPQGTSQLFGSTQPLGTSQLFGSTQPLGTSQPQGTSQLFGASQPQGTSQLFGASQQQGTSQLFGASQPSSTSQLFGASQPSSTSQLFGTSQLLGTSLPICTVQSFAPSQQFGSSLLSSSSNNMGSSIFSQAQQQGGQSQTNFSFGLNQPASSLPNVLGGQSFQNNQTNLGGNNIPSFLTQPLNQQNIPTCQPIQQPQVNMYPNYQLPYPPPPPPPQVPPNPLPYMYPSYGSNYLNRHPYYDSWLYSRYPYHNIPHHNSYAPYAYPYTGGYDEYCDVNNMHRMVNQRSMLWNKYGIESDLRNNLNDRNLFAKNYGRNRGMKQGEGDDKEENEAVINVIPTLAGVKDGKQQIILSIEETAENRSFIPKIFNPNSEISFTIQSKEERNKLLSNAKYIENETRGILNNNGILCDEMDKKNNLPKPIINNNGRIRKSILEMDLNDYHLVGSVNNEEKKEEKSIDNNAEYEKRVMFNNTPVTLKDKYIIFSEEKVDNEQNNQNMLKHDDKKIIRSSPHSGIDKLGGTLNSYNETLLQSNISSIPNNSVVLNNSSSVSYPISKFKWTPSWFISKVISGILNNNNDEGEENNQGFVPRKIIELPPPSINPPSLPPPQSSSSVIKEGEEVKRCNIILSKNGYYIKPSIDELDRMTSNNHCIVNNLIVGRNNVGNIMFHGETDVYGMNIDKLVTISEHEIEVYRDDDINIIKPPVGYGLNKPSTLTFMNVYPRNSDGELIKEFTAESLTDFETYLKNKCKDLDGTFLEYIPESGIFSFNVEHFTKYGLNTHEYFKQSFNTFNLEYHPNTELNLFGHVYENITNDTYSKMPRVKWVNENEIMVYSRNRSDIRKDEKKVNEIRNQRVEVYRIINERKMYIEESEMKIIFNCLENIIKYDDHETPPCIKLDKSIESLRLLSSLSLLNSQIFFNLIYALNNNTLTYTINLVDSVNLSRKKHVLAWIQDTYSTYIENRVKKHLLSDKIFDAVFEYMSIGMIDNAVLLLNEYKYYKVAAMICGCISKKESCDLIFEQINLWIMTNLYDHIDQAYIKIFMLMSSIYIIQNEQHDTLVHVCSNLSWIQCYSIFLIYYTDISGNTGDDYILNALEMYESNFSKYDFIEKPLCDNGMYHIYYNVIKIFTYKSSSMINSNVFEPYSYSEHYFDYSLSFFLYIILESLQLVDQYDTLYSSKIFINFSYQLYLYYNISYHYTLLPILFIKENHIRFNLLQNSLTTILPLLINNNEYISNFFNQLHLPIILLNNAHLTFNYYTFNYNTILNLLFTTEFYETAHNILITKYFPLNLLEKQYTQINYYVNKFLHTKFIHTALFINNAKLYFDYIILIQLNINSFQFYQLFMNIISRLSLMQVGLSIQFMARALIIEQLFHYILQRPILFTSKIIYFISNNYISYDIASLFYIQYVNIIKDDLISLKEIEYNG